MIAGEGMPLDSVVADFIAGAAEVLSPNAPPDHIDVIEGQGSIFHPSYAGVALGLLHGSQPDRFVVCHEPGRTHVLGHAAFPLPSIEQVIEQTIALGRLTNPDIRCAGISLNTAKLDAAEALREIDSVEKRLALPVADPMRGGAAFERLLDACMSERRGELKRITPARFSASCCRAWRSRPWSSAVATRRGAKSPSSSFRPGPGAGLPRWPSQR